MDGRTIRSGDDKIAVEIAQDAGYQEIVKLLNRVPVLFANDTPNDLTLDLNGKEYLIKGGADFQLRLDP